MPTGWVSKINPCKCQVFTTATTASYTSAEKYTLTARTVGISHAVMLASQMAPDRIVAIRLTRTADLGTVKQLCGAATAGTLFCPGRAGGRHWHVFPDRNLFFNQSSDFVGSMSFLLKLLQQ